MTLFDVLHAINYFKIKKGVIGFNFRRAVTQIKYDIYKITEIIIRSESIKEAFSRLSIWYMKRAAF